MSPLTVPPTPLELIFPFITLILYFLSTYFVLPYCSCLYIFYFDTIVFVLKLCRRHGMFICMAFIAPGVRLSCTSQTLKICVLSDRMVGSAINWVFRRINRF